MPVRPTPEPGATRSLRARLAAGPLLRRVAIVDVRIYRFARRDLRLPGHRRLATAYTTTGEHAALWYAVGTVGALTDPRGPGRWRRAMLAVLVTQLTNTAVKGVFRRRRPAVEELPALIKVPTSLSFPSAHSSTSFAAARGFAPLVSRPVARTLYAAAVLMGWSRVYLGVHYPSDIAVGAALGLTVGSAAR